jgi:glycosyltransferase involved in cell wall biosynthesis
MMRLGISGRFYGADVTGVQRFAREVAHRLIAKADVTLLLPRGVQARGEQHATIRSGRLRGHIWEQLEAPAMARAANVELTLHLSGTAPVRDGPAIMAVHDVLPLTNPEWFSWRFVRWYSFVLRNAAPRAAAIITVSEWSKREIIRTLGVPAHRVHVVLQGIGPFDVPAPATAVHAARERWGLPDRFVLALGANDPRKNVGFVSDVMSSWARRWGDPPAVVVAGGEAPRVHGHGHADVAGARVLGRVTDDELRALYTAATAVCFPARAEGFGRTPLEAAACGTPSLVANYGSAREAIDGAALILPLDAAVWAESLYRLFNNADERDAVVQRARERTALMSWDACAEHIFEVCTSVAQEVRARRLVRASARSGTAAAPGEQAG